MNDARGGAVTRRDLDTITGTIFDCSVTLHRALEPGRLECVYEAIVAHDRERRVLLVDRQNVLRFEYGGMTIGEGLRLDLLVEQCVDVELTSVENLNPVHKKQVLIDLRPTEHSVGLLINVGASPLKECLHRIVNNHSLPPHLRASA